MSMLAFFAQAATTTATNAAAATGPDATASQAPGWLTMLPYVFLLVAGYFLFIRPQSVAQKKQAEKLKTAKTGDKIITSSGIHGVISNVKDNTFIVKVADNVKLELEKSHIDKILKASPEAADKA
jgi:preprotein translocase subunit YajC